MENWQGRFRKLISDHEPYRYWLAGWQGRGMKSFLKKSKWKFEFLNLSLMWNFSKSLNIP